LTAARDRAEAARRGDLAARMVQAACDLAILVREENRDAVGRFLTTLTGQEIPEPIRALIVVQAGMIPIDDMSAADMLAWVQWDEHGRPLEGPVREMPVKGRYRPLDELQPCGTYAAYARHKDRGELVDDDCREAARRYWAQRKRQRTSRMSRAA